PAEFFDLRADRAKFARVAAAFECLNNPASDLFHFRGAESTSCNSWSANADAARHKRTTLFVRHGVFVHCDSGMIEPSFGVFAGDRAVLERRKVSQHQVIIGPARDEFQSFGLKFVG